MIKLSAINDEIDNSLEECLICLKDNDIKYVELRKIDDRRLDQYNHEDLLNFKNILKKYDIKVSLIDSSIGKKNIDDYEMINNYIEIAKIFDADKIRIFSDLSDDYLININNLTKENNILLVMENEYNTRFNNIKYFENKKEKLNLDNIFILYDNENYYKDNKEKCIEYNEDIRYIHLRDYSLSKEEYEYFGKGDLELDKLIDYFEKSGYNGIYSIESHLPMVLNEDKKMMISKNIEYTKRWCK